MGTSLGVLYDRWAVGDHPHAYGDKFVCVVPFAFSMGSSPRVWGQDIGGYSGSDSVRIIPTRVGTRDLRQTHGNAGEDHPHACGDKVSCVKFGALQRGSSPRVWGQDFFDINILPSYRIIPTRVGTSLINHLLSSYL